MGDHAGPFLRLNVFNDILRRYYETDLIEKQRIFGSIQYIRKIFQEPENLGHAQVGARPGRRKAITTWKISGP